MLQTLANLGEFLGGMAVIGGVIFAVVQVRQYREGRQREITLELLRSFQTPSFSKALRAVLYMPDGLSREEVEVNILSEEKMGLFGMKGAKPAKVRVSVKNKKT